MLFRELNLHSNLLRALEARGFETPTEIQERAIPIILEGKDLMASAQTGTGKTAAFVLPILHRLHQPPINKGRGPRVLVLTPTRELATQIDNEIQLMGKFSRFVAGSVVGGVGYGPQIRLLRNYVDLLVATPGRLMDHMSQGLVDFSRLEVLVLDEADRMLDMGFVNPVREIASKTPSARQTLLFSATLEGKVLAIGKELMRNPQLVQLASNSQRHEGIEQHLFPADDTPHKRQLLNHCLNAQKWTQAVIFTATRRRADQLTKNLAKDGIRCAAIHGDKSQNARQRTIDDMKSGRLDVLVATDVAARGLDIDGISHVINFDLPMVAEDYIHRIGRTGRAGATGTALSFVGPEDWDRLKEIEKLTGVRLERSIVPGCEPQTSEPVQAAPQAAKGGFRRRGNAGGGGGRRGFSRGGGRRG